MNNVKTFFVGTYSTEGPYVPDAKGKGILSCYLDLETGVIQEMHRYSDHINSTYLAKDEAGHLFAVCDNFEEEGEIRAFSIKKDSSLQLLSSRTTHGTSSCHVEYDLGNKRIFVSSYANGQLSIHGFDGTFINPEPQLLNYKGSGPNSERQEAAHIHQAVFSANKRWLYTCDLGSDMIWLHDLSEEKLQMKTGIPTPAGSGPRHLICHPFLPLAYVLCELDAKLITYRIDAPTGMLEMISQTDTLPLGFKGEPAGAAIRIHPSVKALYVSNRNQDSITVYSISKNGKLKFRSNFSIRGKEPRDFNIDPTGQWLLSANQKSHNIVAFKLDPDSGLPTGAIGSEYNCGTPVCILF